MSPISITIALLLLYTLVQSLPAPKTFLWSPNSLVAARARVFSNDPTLLPAVQKLQTQAKALLSQGPWSVMQKSYIPPSGDKHDYMSLDKYYWPCTQHPNETSATPVPCNTTTGLPFVRYDGYVDPLEKLYDHDRLIDTISSVTTLSLAWYFTEIDSFADHAALILNTWFLDPSTKMNPNLNFGHFIPGVMNGSHGAIIDSHMFPEMLDAVALLSLSNSWSSAQDLNLKSWFRSFLTWLRESELGKQEDAANNNHGVWYDVQAGFIALHVDKIDIATKIALNALPRRVDTQILPDGELPEEEARTKSWSYNEFCLDAFFHLSILVNQFFVEKNLWNSRVHTALDWQLPYVQQKKPWPFKQVVPFIDGCVITEVDQCIGSYFNILRIAANVYLNVTYENTIKTLPGVDYTQDVINLVFPKTMN
eukprot:TRINITY_DN417_c0_g1_i2.p1 TRINITY_DN417_c0_g1~~TRINITY_DN417_c0_g1_i2.p1  ORF type:complete len:442 (-),score=72.11 TRINITY_DN417_c0_g1_i2:146-1411(-)